GAGPSNLAGNTVSISANTGNLTLGPLTSSGALSITNTDNTASNGNIAVTSSLTSTSNSVSLTSGTSGAVNISSGQTLTGNTGVSITTPTLNDSGTVLANTGNIQI